MYFGFNSNLNKQDLVSSVGGGFILKTKKDRLYQFGGGVLNTTTDGTNGAFTPYVGFGAYWKIKLRK